MDLYLGNKKSGWRDSCWIKKDEIRVSRGRKESMVSEVAAGY